MGCIQLSSQISKRKLFQITNIHTRYDESSERTKRYRRAYVHTVIHELTYDDDDRRVMIRDLLKYTFQTYISSSASSLSPSSSLYVMCEADICRYQYRKINSCINTLTDNNENIMKFFSSERQLNKKMKEIKDEVSCGTYIHHEHTIYYAVLKDIAYHLNKYKNNENTNSYCIGIDKDTVRTTSMHSYIHLFTHLYTHLM